MPPRIIYLTQLFDPEPTFKGLTFAKALANSGFDVEVVTGFPNYPGGKIYKGYRQSLLHRETLDGIPVTRLPVYPSHDRSGLRRIVSYFSFFVSAAIYLVFVTRRANVILVFYPSLTAGFAAIIAKLFRRTPVVIDIQDMWPDSLPATGMVRSKLLLGVIAAACKVLYSLTDHVIVLSNGFKKLLVQRGVSASRCTVVYNWAEETDVSEIDQTVQKLYPQDRFNVLFAGNMGVAQGLDTIVEAAALLQEREPRILIHMMGEGIDAGRLQAKANALGLGNIIFRPRVPLKDVQQHLRSADVLLVHLARDPLFEITIPSKTQAYLFAGKPIVMAAEGEAAAMVRASGAGFICGPGSAPGLAEAILQASRLGRVSLDEMGKRGRSFYDRHLSFSSGFGNTEAVLRVVMR